MNRIGLLCAIVLCGLCLAISQSGCRATVADFDSPPNHSSDPARTDSTSLHLLPATSLEGDFVLQQVVTVRWSVEAKDFEESFNAALQRTGESLLILGLGPMGQVGFELRLERDQVHFENRTGRPLPFPPEHILADVQRVFYPWLHPNECTDCQREGSRAGLSILETYSAGALSERRFSILGDLDRGEVVIRYGTDFYPGSIPARADLTNEWVGYALVIETHRRDPIPPRAPSLSAD